MSAAPASAASKDEWRQWAKAVRGGLDFESISAAVVGHLLEWPLLTSAAIILFYLPLPDEVDLTPLLQSDLKERLTLTRTPDRGGGVLTVHPADGPLEVHRLGFVQPSVHMPAIDPADIDVVLLPGLAFDRRGARLGRGAGYFDELTSRMPGAVLAAISPQATVVDRLPIEPHDTLVDWIVTELGVAPSDPATHDGSGR